VAGDAAGGDLAVRALRFGRVTGRARFLNDSAVWLVAIRADLMRGRGGCAVLFLVTALARRRLLAGVRFVALGASFVAGVHCAVLARVAGIAANLPGLRTMG
jgi:hypothetical protein